MRHEFRSVTAIQVAAKRTAPQTSQAWIDYFESNAESLLEIPWERGAELTDAERADVASSLQEFQLGESSEGRHLMRNAERHGAESGDTEYADATRLFICEEQRHARDLGRFLTANGIPLVHRSWPDAVFRWLRKLAGIELSIAVLVTAEIIAKVYYAAIRCATQSRVLERICQQLLGDEFEHVRFQCERLAVLRHDRSRASLAWRHALQRFLFFGTCLVVWLKHGRAMRAGGVGFRAFWQHCWLEMNAALRQMDPRSYAAFAGERRARREAARLEGNSDAIAAAPALARVLTVLVLFGVIFGYLEAAVVVYLRGHYEPIHQRLYPDRAANDLFPVLRVEQLAAEGAPATRLLHTELAREIGTVLLLAVAALSVARGTRQWLASFMLVFGVWDLAYYFSLRLLTGIPSGPFDLDLLFLLPVPWVGPVLAPVLVSLSMIVAGGELWRRECAGRAIRLAPAHWGAIVAGGLGVIAAFCWEFRSTLDGALPTSFPWPLFVLGELIGLAAFLHAAAAQTKRDAPATWRPAHPV